MVHNQSLSLGKDMVQDIVIFHQDQIIVCNKHHFEHVSEIRQKTYNILMHIRWHATLLTFSSPLTVHLFSSSMSPVAPFAPELMLTGLRAVGFAVGPSSSPPSIPA